MNYSLIIIDADKKNKEFISGAWLQNCVGTTLDKAVERARNTEKTNSFMINVGVINFIGETHPHYIINKKRIDNQIIHDYTN